LAPPLGARLKCPGENTGTCILLVLSHMWEHGAKTIGHRNSPKHLRLSKPTDMTIHWKALEEHFLMVPLVFRFNHFLIFKKPQSLKSLTNLTTSLWSFSKRKSYKYKIGLTCHPRHNKMDHPCQCIFWILGCSIMATSGVCQEECYNLHYSTAPLLRLVSADDFSILCFELA
jgi:hypothetical protein